MAHLAAEISATGSNPLDVVEQMVASRDWPFERHDDDEIAAEAVLHGCSYRLWFAWCAERQALHFSCAFDLRVPAGRRAALCELLVAINERMWIGHFDLWTDSGMVVFRQTIPLRGAPRLAAGQLEDLAGFALAECERHYPAFQFLIWGGKSPTEALAAAMFETVGEA